ncbi:hypothetical protein QJS66_20660 [Kocuria rhizophila]|nr:hypothetical protein QJS66_20660 [Kocuria rhizophila]
MIYEAHVKGSRSSAPRSPESDAAPRGGLPPVRDRPPREARRHRGGAHARAPVRAGLHAAGEGPAQLPGLRRHRVLRPARRFSAASHLGSQVRSRPWSGALHQADIEVILDVVYDHTAEGSRVGPTLSMKGVDNNAYYRTVDDDHKFYMDYTGTGELRSTCATRTRCSPSSVSLRYWVTEMHVDGFRFRPRGHARARGSCTTWTSFHVLRGSCSGPIV